MPRNGLAGARRRPASALRSRSPKRACHENRRERARRAPLGLVAAFLVLQRSGLGSADMRGSQALIAVAEAELTVGVLAPAPELAAVSDGARVIVAGGDLEPVRAGGDLRRFESIHRVAEAELAAE